MHLTPEPPRSSIWAVAGYWRTLEAFLERLPKYLKRASITYAELGKHPFFSRKEDSAQPLVLLMPPHENPSGGTVDIFAFGFCVITEDGTFCVFSRMFLVLLCPYRVLNATPTTQFPRPTPHEKSATPGPTSCA